MYSYLTVSARIKNETNASTQALPLIFLTFESILFSITDILFIFLIIYKKWKKSEDATNFQYHSPIFNQLFYCSAVCLIYNNFLFLGSFISDFKSTDDYLLCITLLFIVLETYSVSLSSVFFVSISTFSFLAVIQRIVILYLPSFKCFVMGGFLKFLIAFAYAFLISYIYILIQAESVFYYNVPSQIELIIFHITNTALLIISIFSGWFYYHLYQIVKILEAGNANKAKFLLYQFGPIHTVLLIHSVIQSIKSLLHKLTIIESTKEIEMYTSIIFLPIIPAVVSLSYILAMENFRKLFFGFSAALRREITPS